MLRNARPRRLRVSPVGMRGARRLSALVVLLGVGTALLPRAAGSAGGTAPGQLYAFGGNYYGELGSATNNKTAEPNPTPALVNLPGATGPVTQVAAGEIHSLALTSTGQLYAFGQNRFGQLGNATNDKTEEPNPTPTLVSLPGASGPAVQIAAGSFHSLALTSTGELYAFGDNAFGQLGTTTNNKTTEPNPGPVLVTLPGATGPVTQIAAGAYHSLALTSTGQVFAFGSNEFGQLGNATNDKTAEPNPTPTLVMLPGASGPAVQIAAGGDHSLVLTSTGQLYAFGENFSGQLGNATNSNTAEPNPMPTPVSLPGAASIDTMARGPMADDTLVVLADLAVSSSSLPTGLLGASYAAQLEGLGGTQPYRWSASGLPPGLSLDAATGAITGAPTVTGSYTAAVTLTDADGIEASASLAIPVVKPIIVGKVRAMSLVRAAHSAVVRRGRASVKLTCVGPGGCLGTLKLVARLVQRHRGHGGHHARRTVRNVVIGRASFSIGKGQSETLTVPLSVRGRSLLARSGAGGLKVTVTGSDVEKGRLVLKQAGRAHR